jgi:hypothetical protein
MRRPRIDAAARAQVDRLEALLRTIQGSPLTLKELYVRGYRYPTIKSAMTQGYLRERNSNGALLNEYALTNSGKRYLATLDEALLLQ